MKTTLEKTARKAVVIVSTFVLIGPILSAFAAPSTEGLLTGLPPEMRKKILAGADAAGICELHVLEKEMGIRFAAGSPPSGPTTLGGDKPCGEIASGAVANISSAADLLDEKKRFAWFAALPAYCQFKRKYTEGLKAASVKLQGNLLFNLTNNQDRIEGRHCYFDSIASLSWEVGQAMCFSSKGSSATALECFYTQECRMGCGPGAMSLQFLAAYEIFKGADGILDEREQALFDFYYPKIEIGEFHGDDSSTGIEATDSPFEGVKAPRRKSIDLSHQAAKGAHALTGLRVVMDTKNSYKTNHRSYETDFDKWINLSENSIVLSTSAKGADQIASQSIEGTPLTDSVVGQFEKDMAIAQKALKLMDYLGTNEGVLIPKVDPRLPKAEQERIRAEARKKWKAYDQFVSKEYRDAVLAGTHAFYNVSEEDRGHINRALAILQKPMYRDTKVFVHPLGELSLSALALRMFKAHEVEAPLTLWSPKTGEDEHYEIYVASRVATCMGH